MRKINPSFEIVTGTVRGVALYRAKEIEDPRGFPVASAFPDTLPFVPKRYFLVHDGTHQVTYVLNHPAEGLYIPPMLWASEYTYSADARQMCLAADTYDPEDYIRDYDRFLKEVASS